jgi:hypothetical protein
LVAWRRETEVIGKIGTFTLWVAAGVIAAVVIALLFAR